MTSLRRGGWKEAAHLVSGQAREANKQSVVDLANLLVVRGHGAELDPKSQVTGNGNTLLSRHGHDGRTIVCYLYQRVVFEAKQRRRACAESDLAALARQPTVWADGEAATVQVYMLTSDFLRVRVA